MTNAFLIIQTLGFALGVVLFTLLLFLIGRTRETSESPLAAAGGWVWNTGNLALYSGLLAGAERASATVRLSNAFAYSGAAFLSTGFFLVTAPEGDVSRRSIWRRRFLIVSFGVAAVLSAGLFLSALVPGFPIEFNLWRLYCGYNLPFHIAVAILFFRRRPPARDATQLYRYLMTAMVIALSLALMTQIHMQVNAQAGVALRIAAEQSSIPMGLLAIVAFSKVSFADRFAKRSILILTATTIALVFYGFALQPLIAALRSRSPYPLAVEWIATILLWSTLLLCFPEFKRRLDDGVDRLLFQRPDYRGLAQTFSQRCEQAEQESQVIELTETTIMESLGVSTIFLEDLDELDLRPDQPPVIQVLKESRLRRLRPEIEWLVPIESGGRMIGALGLISNKSSRRLLSDEFGFLANVADRAGRSLDAIRFEKERRERALAMERMQHLLTEAELRALQAQINPHFLFNTLNTIADLIGRSPEKAETLTEQLAEIFRYALTKSDAHEVSLKDEFQFLKTYLEIEQARFGSRLTTDLQLEKAVEEERIPPLLLQPLVENAVKHGVAQSRTGGRVEVRAYPDHEGLRLSVTNDAGDWREDSQGNGHGVGLRNIRERLAALYESRARLVITSVPGKGTQVQITISRPARLND